MSKKKHSPEWMLARVQEYLAGKGSYKSIASANGVGQMTLFAWVRKYQEQGEGAFYEATGNKHYSKEFKIKCVEAVLSGEGSVDDIFAAAAAAADEGAEASKNFVSKFGRARSYGEATLGTPDAGAMSMKYFFAGLAKK